MAALERERSCSDVFARAIECGESVARPLQRGKKTWENKQGLDRLRKQFCGTVETQWFLRLGQIWSIWLFGLSGPSSRSCLLFRSTQTRYTRQTRLPEQKTRCPFPHMVPPGNGIVRHGPSLTDLLKLEFSVSF